MPVYRNKYKYQLVHPVVGTCAYQTTSLKKGAKKCYEELKALDNINASHFTVLNVDTYETYKFEIDSKSQLANNSNLNNINTNTNMNTQTNNITLKIDILQETINKIDRRVEKLEKNEPNKIHEDNETQDLCKSSSFDKYKNNNTNNTNMKTNTTDDIIANALSGNIYKIPKIQEKNKMIVKQIDIDEQNYDVDQNDNGTCIIM